MREIKFRIWDKNLNDYAPPECVLGFLVNISGNELTLHCDEYIIEQYTGLKDKNGKEIYFNSDKVKGVDSHGITYTGYIDNSDPYCTMITDDGGDSIPIHIFAYSEPFEIIGNIHDGK